MNRLLSCLLIFCLLLTMASCRTEQATDPTTSTPAATTPSTTQPTKAPTEAPTKAPTEAPTEPPTEAPTEPPTEAPTEAPTEPPTEAPTEAPTEPPVSGDPSDTLTVSNDQDPKNPGSTYTGRAPLDNVTFTIQDPDNARGLSTDRSGFSFGVAKGGQPHRITVNNQARFDDLGYNALAWDNRSGEKVLYLSFDCGYAYGTLVSDILDVLEEKQVPAAFFCTLPYLKSSPGDVTRMIQQGHTVGNHSVNHPDFSTISRTRMALELLGVHNYLRVNFGYDSRYFRFPTGANSVSALELVDSVGYRSVFWSIAHADWDPENQPGTDVTFQTVTSRLHPGAVILLHSTSPDNVAVLADIIDYARSEGYVFRSLDDYPGWG